jgi:25S rRNA (uracil2634-N3)-methyltransferase
MSTNNLSQTPTSMTSKARKRPLDDGEPSSIDGDLCATTRDCADLYAIAATVKCAFTNNCIPCSYKVGSFDVALDSDICQKIPNQRPEMCPRSKTNQIVGTRCSCDENPLGYKDGMSVLTVGDGDFSFSLALARFRCNVVATSYESRETVQLVYDSVGVNDHIAELEMLGGKIFYNVDATNLQNTLPSSLKERKFQRIVWNFPCSAVAKGQDGQNVEMENNKQLVRIFVESAEQLCDGGQIHINHKTKPPFNQWKIQEVAVSNSQKVRFLYRVVLDRNVFRPYTPRKALDRKSFPFHDACTYIFDVIGEYNRVENDGRDAIAVPDLASIDRIPATQLVPVTPHLIRQLRKLLQNQPVITYQRKRKGGYNK